MRKGLILLGFLAVFGCSNFTPAPGTDTTEKHDISQDSTDVTRDTAWDRQNDSVTDRGGTEVMPDAGSGEDVQNPPDLNKSCNSDVDCKGMPLPGEACKVAKCQDGTCVPARAPKGTKCVPETPSGVDPKCIGGTCDANGVCNAVILSGTPCDDNDPCTSHDKCDDQGMCKGTPVHSCCQADKECDDGNPCTLDTCADHTCKNDIPGANMTSCGTKGLCWNGHCLNPDMHEISMKPKIGQVTNATMVAVGNLHSTPNDQPILVIAGVFRQEDVKMSGTGWVSKGTFTDFGGLYLWKDDDQQLSHLNTHAFRGMQGHMDTTLDGSYTFPDTAMSTPVTDVAFDMAVGESGQVATINIDDNPPSVDLDPPLKSKLTALNPSNLYTAWHGLDLDAPICGTSTDYYLIGGVDQDNHPLIALCTRYVHCHGDIMHCQCDTPKWACQDIKWNAAGVTARAVTGWSDYQDYMNSGLPSKVSNLIVNGDFPGGFMFAPINDSNASTIAKKVLDSGEHVTDLLGITESTGMVVTDHHLFWYDLNRKTVVSDITPGNLSKDKCKFYKGSVYKDTALIVAVCQVYKGGGDLKLCNSETRLYYANTSKAPTATDIHYAVVDSYLGCKQGAYQGRAVAAYPNGFAVVGGNRRDEGFVQVFKQ